MMRRIVCIAIIGRKSEPLFLRTPDPEATPQDSVGLSGLIHTALDVVEEKIHKMATGGLAQQYLGPLYNVLDLRIYGYVSNTLTKFIVVVRDPGGEGSMRQWLQAFHRLYVAHLCNPFTPLDTKLQPGPRFNQQLAALIARWEERNHPQSSSSSVPPPGSPRAVKSGGSTATPPAASASPQQQQQQQQQQHR